MPQPPTSGPDALNSAPASTGMFGGQSDARLETDLTDLAARFTAQSGGGLSPELSADLALEIVLNEIVEQACLATAATGAAVVLQREGELVCRASSGANAPELGSRLGIDSGLTAACIRAERVQRCDDTEIDQRVDSEASRRLGVRSVMIFPLLRHGDLVGVLEILSSQPFAFGERDELTLKALAHRILKNLELARDGLRAPAESAPAGGVLRISSAESEDEAGGWEASPAVSPLATGVERRGPATTPAVTFVLAAAVVVCAILLGTVVGVRLGWRRAVARLGQVTKSAPAMGATQNGPRGELGAPSRTLATGLEGKTEGNVDTATVKADPAKPTPPASALSDVSSRPGAPAKPSQDSVAEGSLLVYENGREIFRMPPDQGGVQAEATADGPVVRPASSVQSAQILQPSWDTKGSLLYSLEPEYPEEARQQSIEGRVVLEVGIGADGKVREVKAVSGPRLLADAALAAVKQWRFKARKLNGKPTEMQTKITLNFRLPSSPKM